MNKKEKTEALDKWIAASSSYCDASKVGNSDRIYENDGVFVKFADVSTRQGDNKVFHGFVTVEIPNPTDDYDTQLENLMNIISSKDIVEGCIKSITIEQQAAARKVALGKDNKISKTEFNTRFNNLDADVIQRLKTMEHITEHIENEWRAEQADTEDGQLHIF